MKRRPAATGEGFSLFPFLAVLICTMGSLLVLLVVVARQARIQAAEARQNGAAQAKLLLQELDEHLAALAAAKARNAELVAQRRAQLAASQRELDQLQAELSQLAAAQEKLQAARRAGQATDEQRAELLRLQTEIARIEAEIEQARRRGQSPASYAIVPYEGPNQTRRRPLYIECRRDCVVIQPEGVILVVEDFEGPLGPNNPLASAIRAAEQYLRRNQNTNLRETGEPYPLLLVRPDGIDSFYAARAALRSWGAEFGYEFIDQEWQVDYKPADEALKTVEQTAVTDARQRQHALAGFGLSGNGGGSGTRSGTGGSGAGGSLARREFSSASGRPTSRPTYRVSPAGGGLIREGGSGGMLAGGGTPARRPSYTPIYGNSPTDVDGPAGSYGSGNLTSPSGTMGDPSAISDRYASREVGNGPSPNEASTVDPRDPYGTGYGQPNGPQNASSELSGYGGPAATGAANGNRNPEQNGLTPAPDSLAGNGGTATTTPGGSTQQTGSPDQPSANPSAQRSATETSSASSGGSPSPSFRAAMQGGQPGAGEGPAIVKQQLFGQAVRGGGQAESLAAQRGQNWGLPDASLGSFPVTRPIRMQCTNDYLVMLPDVPGAPGGKQIPLAPRTADSVDALISAVWEHMDDWGIAGRGLYWRPILVMDVQPGGETRLAELQRLLADSGLTIEVKKKAPAPRSAARP